MSWSIPLPCPHCGVGYRVDSDYLTAYGGKHTQCTRCKQRYRLPTVEEVISHYQESQQQTPNLEDAVSEFRVMEDANRTAEATGIYDESSHGVWQDGFAAVFSGVPKLPARCYRCNEGAVGKPISFQLSTLGDFSYERTGVRELSVLTALLSPFVNRHGLRIQAHVCPKHRSLRILLMAIGPIVFAIGIAAFVVSFYQYMRWSLAYGKRTMDAMVIGSLLVAGLGIALWRCRGMRLRLVSRTPGQSRVEGFGKPFLESLPSVHGSTAR